jgi:hypothetical protein
LRKTLKLLQFALLVGLCNAQQPSPFQKLLWENEFVRVFELRVPAGASEAKHSHGRGVTIALTDYDNELTSYPDGAVTRRHTKFGEVRWADPVTHEARNTGPTEQHVIRVELKKDRHAHGVLIPLADSDVESVDDPGGQPTRRQLKFGDASWREPVVHAVKNVGKSELLNVRIELK